MMRILIVGSLVMFMTSCLKPPDYSPIPAITFDSISSTFATVNQDSITFLIGFTDGDGDLGSDDSANLFFVDNRTGTPLGFKIPYLTPSGDVKAITGTIAYNFSSFNCTPPASRLFDTVIYSIYIVDRAGNPSNTIQSPPIILQCN